MNIKKLKTWPRKDYKDRDSTCKGTKRGAYHYVNPSGTGGPARKMNRMLAREQ